MAIPTIDRVVIKFIKHETQRYPTCGDWELFGKSLIISVSRMEDVRHMLLVAIHELEEALICFHQGVTQEQVDEFDIQFEAKREEGNNEEPGGDPQAPYYDAHQFASRHEKELAKKLEVDWETYEAEINAL